MILAVFLIMAGGVAAAGFGYTWLAILAAVSLQVVVVAVGRVAYRQRQNEKAERRIRLREAAWRATERYR